MKPLYFRLLAIILMTATLFIAPCQARTICTIVADTDTGKILLQNGNCAERVTAASTFKIALSLMGFDSGFLKDQHAPSLPFHEGYADWGGDNWRQPTDPAAWMKYSVVWYSQQITNSLGETRFKKYVNDFAYGNADISGDPGKNNGLERAWISSSLKISPMEQITFLKKIIKEELQVSPHALAMTKQLTLLPQSPGGWVIHGKTGSGFPKNTDGNIDEVHAYGWFVGWAEKDKRTLVFARLTQDEKEEQGPAGVRARDVFLGEWEGFLKIVFNE
ncbi:class D beta-lactamase [Undibacterium sp. TJN19]|uniref:class D beta-lactamase n=1 Tax=Undibacterium sp. TJN19 TaxID=3413055 RepID=UPI003BF3EC27